MPLVQIDEAEMLWVGASVGAMAVVIFFSLAVASVYHEKALAWHAAVSALAALASWQMSTELASWLGASVLALLAAASIQLCELVAHLQDGTRIQARLRLLAAALLLAAAGAAWFPQGLAAGLALWCIWTACELWRVRQGCRPWIRNVILGDAALTGGVALLAVDGPAAAAPASALLVIWTCNVYLATVWRHRRLSDAQLTLACNRFMSMLGHDLRSPLQAISLSAAVLETTKDVTAVGQRIQRSSSRMERMIVDLLDLSRLQNGMGLPIRRQPIDLGAVVAQIVDDFRLRGARIDFACQGPVALLGDSDRLAQVVENLLSNACRHGAPDVPVRVSVSDDGQKVRLRVANKGAAIPAKDRPNLFSPFKPGSGGDERNRQGLGLGLYIANEIVRSHGGALSYEWVAPDVVFNVKLPG